MLTPSNTSLVSLHRNFRRIQQYYPSHTGNGCSTFPTSQFIVIHHVQQANDDDTDSFGLLSHEPGQTWEPVALSDLFNFSSEYWTSLYSRFAALTFEDELELYDLADMDADGISDEFDDVTGVVLVS